MVRFWISLLKQRPHLGTFLSETQMPLQVSPVGGHPTMDPASAQAPSLRSVQSQSVLQEIRGQCWMQLTCLDGIVVLWSSWWEVRLKMAPEPISKSLDTGTRSLGFILWALSGEIGFWAGMVTCAKCHVRITFNHSVIVSCLQDWHTGSPFFPFLTPSCETSSTFTQSQWKGWWSFPQHRKAYWPGSISH